MGSKQTKRLMDRNGEPDTWIRQQLLELSRRLDALTPAKQAEAAPAPQDGDGGTAVEELERMMAMAGKNFASWLHKQYDTGTGGGRMSKQKKRKKVEVIRAWVCCHKSETVREAMSRGVPARLRRVSESVSPKYIDRPVCIVVERGKP